ncbi:RNA polymerase sigma factor [Planctomycetes bacterium Poly30]|uniref:RNA polymerase sigma factor n=2 Tax=Saltatorellus ferox TaxID=2528018 RepID=A0A518EWT4_9BACT|nr:RNA polymerase sigma factor [Planctomycetes bacterium Poly30]
MVHQQLAGDIRMHRPWLRSRFSTGDVVQEVFRSVVQDLNAFGGKTADAFCGYLAMMVRNRIMDAIRFHQAARRDGRRGQPIDHTPVAEGNRTPFDEAASQEELTHFLDVLSTFPEREQLLLRARLEDQETFDQLKDQLGYGSISAVRRAFYAAQAKLAVQLGETA